MIYRTIELPRQCNRNGDRSAVFCLFVQFPEVGCTSNITQFRLFARNQICYAVSIEEFTSLSLFLSLSIYLHVCTALVWKLTMVLQSLNLMLLTVASQLYFIFRVEYSSKKKKTKKKRKNHRINWFRFKENFIETPRDKPSNKTVPFNIKSLANVSQRKVREISLTVFRRDQQISTAETPPPTLTK